MPKVRYSAPNAIRYAPLVFLFSCLMSLGAHGADRDVRVLRYEPVSIDFQGTASSSNPSASKKSTATVGTMRFSAFGKSYTIALQPNTNLATALATGATRAQALRGTLDGRANSWARITRVGDKVHGLFFDGAELLAIEPASAIDAPSVEGTVIFRLADTQTDLGSAFCAVLKTPVRQSSDTASGLAIFNSLSSESKQMLAQMQTAGVSTRLQLSALMDIKFRQRYSDDVAANDAIVARVNNIDGIFSSQLGVEVELTTVLAPETPNTPIFNSTDPGTLLQAVAKLRGDSPNLYSSGVTHLFTGTDMDGTTVGIAYMDGVCGQRYAASVSEARDRGVWFDSLVAAHELGHSFGSPHDGEGACAATPTTFLMAPTINGNDHFSQCSLGIIESRVQTASCLIPIPLADISLPASLGDYHALLNKSFAWSISASNIGNAEALGANMQITVPPALTVSDAKVANGTCTVGAGVVSCDFGTMAIQETRNVELTLIGTQTGTHSLSATVGSRTDMNAANNVATGTIRIDPSADVAVSLTMPSTAIIDQSLNATFTVVNKSSVTVQNLTVEIVVPTGFAATGTTLLDGVACQVQFQTILCTTAELAAGRTITGSLALVAREAGTQTLTASLNGNFDDPNPQDNAAQQSTTVTAQPIVSAASAPPTKSGGGAMNLTQLLVLLILFSVARRYSNRRSLLIILAR